MASWPRIDVFRNGHLIGFGGPQEAGPIFWGVIASDGTPVLLPTGWTCSRISVGVYRVTHNLAAAIYGAMCTARGGVKIVAVPGNYLTNSFDINAVTLPSGTDTDVAVSFAVALLS